MVWKWVYVLAVIGPQQRKLYYKKIMKFLSTTNTVFVLLLKFNFIMRKYVSCTMKRYIYPILKAYILKAIVQKLKKIIK